MKRGVDDLELLEAALLVGHGAQAQLAAPGLAHGDRQLFWPQRQIRRGCSALLLLCLRQFLQGPLDHLQRAFYLLVADLRPGADVAAFGSSRLVGVFPVPAIGMIAAQVLLQPAGSGRHAHQAYVRCGLTLQRAGIFKTVQHAGVIKQQVQGIIQLFAAGLQPGQQLRHDGWRGIIAHAAWAYQAAPKAVAAKLGGHIQELAAQPSAICHRRPKGDVVGQRAQVAAVICQALQLPGQQAQSLSPGARPQLLLQAFQQLGICSGVGAAAVAAAGLQQVYAALVRSLAQQALDAPMLVAQ